MTGHVIPLDGDGHRTVQSLLAWYVAGRLDAEDRSLVETHLAGCAECQAELKLERQLAAALGDLPGPAGDVERGWAAIQRRMGPVDPAPWRTRLAAVWRRVARPAPIEPAWARWALAGQACLVLALGAALWQQTRPQTYQALGAAEPQTRASIIVVFEPDTTEAQLRAIVRGSQGRLVGGPTETDAYLIAAPDGARTAALEALRSQPQVVLAEPIDGAEAP